MCLIVFAWKTHPDYQLVLAANRDEFHRRPSQALRWWPDDPNVLAGRDLQAGGTWLAASRSGRFATVTNYREQQQRKKTQRSRGELVANFVSGNSSAASYSQSIAGENYAGFSLLVADNDDLYFVSNRGDDPTLIAPGIYGLSNASLDTPWPKLQRSRDGLRSLIESGSLNETELMRLMSDRTMVPVADVEPGPLPFKFTRALTAPFIVSTEYGTRCSTVYLRSKTDDVTLNERRFDSQGKVSGESRFIF